MSDADYLALVMPEVGEIVHIGGPGHPCRPAIVLEPAAMLTRVRILIRSFNGPAGRYDEEGDVRHFTALRQSSWIPKPSGGFRLLDTWHRNAECALVTYPDPVIPSVRVP